MTAPVPDDRGDGPDGGPGDDRGDGPGSGPGSGPDDRGFGGDPAGTTRTVAGRHARPPRTAGDVVRALARRCRAQAALTVVLAVVVVAFWRIGEQHWRQGTTLLGVALLLGAVLRAALTDRAAGLLAVRPRRGADVAVYAVFGAVVILVSLTITGGPLAAR